MVALRLFFIVVACFATGCGSGTPPSSTDDSGPDSDSDTDTDADVDTDADTDTDSDTDTDTDADSDTDTEPRLAVQVSCGGMHTCAVLDNGRVRCWGANASGQLGYGHTENIGDDETPASAGFVDVGGNVTAIAAGGWHTCALLDTGSVRCWGAGTFGQLGYGNTETIGDDETPASAGDVDVGGTVVDIAAGARHTCALLDTGSVRCWGGGDTADYNFGQLGYGIGNTSAIGDNETPASAGDVPVGGTVLQIATGYDHTCAMLDTGEVRCWGLVLYGRLGYGTSEGWENIGDNETPASVGPVNMGGTAVAVAAGGAHTCALLESGAVVCWGRNEYGQLGYGNTEDIGDDELPYTAGGVDVGGEVETVDLGSQNSCALLSDGSVRCWGQSYLGYVNNENVGDDETPASAGDIDVGGTVVQISTGGVICGLLDDGHVRCWGGSSYGALGYGNTEIIGDDETPASAGDVPI